MFSPGFKISRINLKPLLPEAIWDRFSPEKALRDLKKEVMKSIRFKIRQYPVFSPAAKARLVKGFDVRVGDSSITLVAKDPAFRPLIEGQRAAQMRWLRKARSPIPIVLESGEVIFRSATARSMARGSWYHPGREPTNIIETAKAEAKAVLRARTKRLLRDQLRSALARR
jgi:hypothetical protein